MNKEIFERFKQGKFDVVCETEKQAQEFVKLCYENGISWVFSSVNDTFFDNELFGYICYNGEDGTLSWYAHEEDDQMSFDDFMKEYNNLPKVVQFTKADLKTGMLVVLRDKREYVVYKDIYTHYTERDERYTNKDVIVYSQDNSWEYLSLYLDDLSHYNDPSGDIVKVYKLSHPYCLQDIDMFNDERELLWERFEQPIIELTLDEISERLGYKVKIKEEN